MGPLAVVPDPAADPLAAAQPMALAGLELAVVSPALICGGAQQPVAMEFALRPLPDVRLPVRPQDAPLAVEGPLRDLPLVDGAVHPLPLDQPGVHPAVVVQGERSRAEQTAACAPKEDRLAIWHDVPGLVRLRLAPVRPRRHGLLQRQGRAWLRRAGLRPRRAPWRRGRRGAGAVRHDGRGIGNRYHCTLLLLGRHGVGLDGNRCDLRCILAFPLVPEEAGAAEHAQAQGAGAEADAEPHGPLLGRARGHRQRPRLQLARQLHVIRLPRCPSSWRREFFEKCGVGRNVHLAADW
mmetsp:Transcript_21018/g.58224  ORF Transcript_21018/g.58224 Transcript_21018/m.58224 type:complete len:294 (-) Transcript_21018:171-1052(-)